MRLHQAWLIVGAAGLLVLPWHGLESPLAAIRTLDRSSAPAMFTGELWLWPLLLPLLIGLAGGKRRLVAAGIAGLALLAAQGLAIGLHGWGAAWLTALFGPGPSQAAMGWGAVAYALCAVMLLAIGLARLGWCRGDVFVLGALLLILGLVVLFVAWPVGAILRSAAQDNDGAWALALFGEKFFNPGIWGLDCIGGGKACGVAWNTLAQATVVGVLSTLLGLAFALVAVRTSLPLRPLVRVLS
ncbi:MAG: iron ABC transporter permease, partial [Alphaproteobacteria bacterium]|nr:iron ABC transporter permease [Alphaproteobacteria bacterium]